MPEPSFYGCTTRCSSLAAPNARCVCDAVSLAWCTGMPTLRTAVRCVPHNVGYILASFTHVQTRGFLRTTASTPEMDRLLSHKITQNLRPIVAPRLKSAPQQQMELERGASATVLGVRSKAKRASMYYFVLPRRKTREKTGSLLVTNLPVPVIRGWRIAIALEMSKPSAAAGGASFLPRLAIARNASALPRVPHGRRCLLPSGDFGDRPPSPAEKLQAIGQPLLRNMRTQFEAEKEAAGECPSNSGSNTQSTSPTEGALFLPPAVVLSRCPPLNRCVSLHLVISRPFFSRHCHPARLFFSPSSLKSAEQAGPRFAADLRAHLLRCRGWQQCSLLPSNSLSRACQR